MIPLLLSVILAIRYALEEDASPASRVSVVIVVAASLWIWHFAPRWLVAATLLQVAAGVYVLVYFRLGGR